MLRPSIIATGGLITIFLIVLIVWQLDSIKILFNLTPVKISGEDIQLDKYKGHDEQIEVHDKKKYILFQKEPVSDASNEQNEEERTYVSETVNQSEESFLSPVPALRPDTERTDDILKQIGDLKGIITKSTLRRIFALKTAVIESSGINPELVISVNSLLGQMELVRKKDQGACDLLVALNDSSQGIYLTVRSNLFGDERNYLYQENYNFTNDRQLLTLLETIVSKYYCFNIMQSFDLLKSVNDGYDTAVTFNGGSNDMFRVGDTIEICLTSNHEAYFMLLNANAEGLYMLFPQTREEHISLISGKTFCTEPMAVSPPTGNELIAAIMFTDKSLLSIDRHFADDDQLFIEPASWPYNLIVPDNAVQYCEKLFTILYNALTVEYSTQSRFIKTYQIVSHDQAANYRELGIAFFNENKYPDAIAELVKAANVNPDDEVAIKYLSLSHFNQAMILFDSKKYLQAKEGFEASLRYDEKCKKCSEFSKKSEEFYKQIHYDKGISYFGDEQLAEAISEWELVYSLDPNYKEVESNLKKAKIFSSKLKQIENY
ncbi:MAG: hypothetical protein ABFS32_19515 [Bacteroidota bacterium]